MLLTPRRRLYRRALGDVAVPHPFDLGAFCANIERARGRQLVMHQLTAKEMASFCGLFVGLRSADHVFYPAGTSPVRQQHIVLHELAHLLAGHVGRSQRGTSFIDSALKIVELAAASDDGSGLRLIEQADQIVLSIGVLTIGAGLLLPALETVWTAAARQVSDRVALLRLRVLWSELTSTMPGVVLGHRPSIWADPVGPDA